MKPAFEHTPQRSWESFHCEVVKGSSYNATWHFHPEVQLTLVLKSTGYRLVGDNISPLVSGDMVLVGPNLPHVWHQEDDGRNSKKSVHAIVVRFLPTFLGSGFLEIPEAAALNRLLLRARRGLHVTGRARDVVSDKLQELPYRSGLDRVAGLLSILETLSRSDSLHPIASSAFLPEVSQDDQARLDRVLARLHQDLPGNITRARLAREAHMNESAFSRFFKLRTGKTLPEYVNEVRIGRACQLLADYERKVVDIAVQCGFENLANFNRRFLRITGLNPRDYRLKLRATTFNA